MPDQANRIRLRWEGTCCACQRSIPARSWALHDRAARTVRCEPCAVEPDYGTPGGGARRRYEQLHQRREDELRSRYGAVGLVAGRLVGDPQHIAAWKRGAEGEEWLAARLEKLLRATAVRLLHDRRIPGSKANIDHIAVGPGGVTVIDPKNVRGRVRIEKTGGIFSPRVTKLRVAGRDRTSYVDGMERQVRAVRTALDDAGHPEAGVAAVLCFLDPESLPLFGTFRVRDVALAGPRAAAKLARRDGPMSPAEVDALSDALARRLPPA
jgi:hypothetical protein